MSVKTLKEELLFFEKSSVFFLDSVKFIKKVNGNLDLMQNSYDSCSEIPDDMLSNSPELCASYIRKENSQISEENEKLIKQVRVLKEQFDRAVDSNSDSDEILQENCKLKEEVAKLKIEKEDFSQRLKILINKNKQIEIDSNRKVSEIENSIMPMKQQYESQIQKLNLQNVRINELKNQTETDFSLLQTQSNSLLSIAQDIYGTGFLSLQSLAEFLNERESSTKKKIASIEEEMQVKVDKAESNAKKWKLRFKSQKEAADITFQDLNEQINSTKMKYEGALKTIDDLNREQEHLSKKDLQEDIAVTPNLTIMSDFNSPVKTNNEVSPFMQQQYDSTITQYKSTLNDMEMKLNETESKYNIAQQNMNVAEDKISKLEAELNKCKETNNSLENALNQIKDSQMSNQSSTIDKILQERTEKEVEQARNEKEELRKELEATLDELNELKKKENSFSRMSDDYKNKMNGIMQESDMHKKNLADKEAEINSYREKFMKSESDMNNFRNELQQAKFNNITSSETIAKQEKQIKELKEKLEEKEEMLKKVSESYQELKETYEKEEKSRQTVRFVKPVSWNDYHLSQEVVKMLKKNVSTDKTEKEQLEDAIVLVSDRYHEKMNELIADTKKRVATMSLAVQKLVTQGDEKIKFSEILKIIKSKLNDAKEIQGCISNLCNEYNVNNIDEFGDIIEKAIYSDNQMKKQINDLINEINIRDDEISNLKNEIIAKEKETSEKIKQCEKESQKIINEKVAKINEIEAQQMEFRKRILEDDSKCKLLESEKIHEKELFDQQKEQLLVQIKDKNDALSKVTKEKESLEITINQNDASHMLIKKQFEKIKKSRNKYASSVKILTQTIEEIKKSYRQKKKSLREDMRNQETTLMERIRRENSEHAIALLNLNHEIEKLRNENDALNEKMNEVALESKRIEIRKNAEINTLQQEKKHYETQNRANILLATKHIRFANI